MSDCAQNIVSLGCFSPCDPINTGVVATVTGTWKARVLFQGVALTTEFEATQGQVISIANGWPEDLSLLLQLIKPDGTALDDKFYQFKNKITIEL